MGRLRRSGVGEVLGICGFWYGNCGANECGAGNVGEGIYSGISVAHRDPNVRVRAQGECCGCGNQGLWHVDAKNEHMNWQVQR